MTWNPAARSQVRKEERENHSAGKGKIIAENHSAGATILQGWTPK